MKEKDVRKLIVVHSGGQCHRRVVIVRFRSIDYCEFHIIDINNGYNVSYFGYQSDYHHYDYFTPLLLFQLSKQIFRSYLCSLSAYSFWCC